MKIFYNNNARFPFVKWKKASLILAGCFIATKVQITFIEGERDNHCSYVYKVLELSSFILHMFASSVLFKIEDNFLLFYC